MGGTQSNPTNPVVFLPPTPATYKRDTFANMFWITTSRGILIPLYYHRHAGATWTVLFSHGNAEDLNCVPWLQMMCDRLNVSVCTYDYSGYGLSRDKNNKRPKPCQRNCFADAEAVWSFLTEDHNVDPSSILLYGRSLGSGPTCHLAQRAGASLGGVYLQSPLQSTVRVVFPKLGFSLWPLDQFNNLSAADRFATLVCIIHGLDDEVIPVLNGQKLHAKLVKLASLDQTAQLRVAEPRWLSGAGHNNIEADFADVLIQHWLEFIDLAVRRQQELAAAATAAATAAPAPSAGDHALSVPPAPSSDSGPSSSTLPS